MAITETTLSAAISTTSENVICLTSATAVVVGGVIRVDAEAMSVVSKTGSQVTVRRGAAGTIAKTHANGAAAYVGSAPEFALPVLDFVGSSLTGTAGATASKGYLAVIVDGTLRYIPLTDSV